MNLYKVFPKLFLLYVFFVPSFICIETRKKMVFFLCEPYIGQWLAGVFTAGEGGRGASVNPLLFLLNIQNNYMDSLSLHR